MTCTDPSLAEGRAVLAQVCLRLRSWLWPHSWLRSYRRLGWGTDSGSDLQTGAIIGFKPMGWLHCTPHTAGRVCGYWASYWSKSQHTGLWLDEAVTSASSGWFARLGGGCYGGWAGLCWLTCDVSRDCVTVCWELSCVQYVTAMWHNVGCVSHLMCLCQPVSPSHSGDHSVSPLVSDHWLVTSLSLSSLSGALASRPGGGQEADSRPRPGSQNVLTSFADNISKAGQLIAPTHPAHFTSLPHYFLITDVLCVYF